MQQTLITVGITAYREGKLLREAWQSVLNQTLQDWKAILVLDGGADELTQKIFDEINDVRAKKIKMSRRMGPYPCRNTAIENCETELYFFLDGDDLLAKNDLEEARKIFLKNEYDYLCVRVDLFNSKGHIKTILPFQTTPERLVKYFEYPGLLVAFKKKVWEEIGGYTDALKHGRADFDFLLTLVEGDYQAAFVSEIIYYYRQKDYCSVSKSYTARLGRIHEKIVARHSHTFANKDLRQNFLHHGYRLSAWTCFIKGNIKRAYYFAKKGNGVGKAWYYFPLNMFEVFPTSLVIFLAELRVKIGDLFRSLKERLYPVFKH
jgi:glycosyltransferase involved in cell wall biosynthesis